jgi:hypothetical protein
MSHPTTGVDHNPLLGGCPQVYGWSGDRRKINTTKEGTVKTVPSFVAVLLKSYGWKGGKAFCTS